MKKILFIMGCLENGGGEKSLVNLLNLFDKDKYKIDLLLFKKRGKLMNQIPSNINIINDCDILNFMYEDKLLKSINFKHPVCSFFHIFGTIYSKFISKSGFQKGQIRWKKFYKKVIPNYNVEYDVAISYLEGETTYFMIDKINAKKKIAWVHTDYTKINPIISHDLYYFNKVDNIITISTQCKNILINMFPTVKNKIEVLPNLTDSSNIKKLSNMYIPNEMKNKKKKILSIGRLVYLKGFDIAIKAAYILKQKELNFVWYVIGDGELHQELQNMIDYYGLKDNFILLGLKENPYVYMKYSDVIVQSSRYEGKSMVLDEAKILSKPIVVTNYDTVKDQINDNEGKIVEMSANGLAKGIIEMLASSHQYIEYLSNHEYGNQNEILSYYKLIEK